MCQSSDCQQQQQFGLDCLSADKENWDWNNNNNNNSNMSAVADVSPLCQCSAQRRTRRRHPATIQTPGRLEVGDVFLEPLVSNRLEDSPGQDRASGHVKANWNLNNYSKQQQQQTSYLFATQQPPVQSLNTKQRFEVLGENFRSSSGSGSSSCSGGWNQNFASQKFN